jgi:hypothetical protein
MGFWNWLNNLQHPAAIQAITSIVYTVAAIVAGSFAAGAYVATKKQADEAHKSTEFAKQQTELVREQTRYARDQTALAERQYEDEKKRRLQNETRQINGDRDRDKLDRPRFKVVSGYTSSLCSVDLQNVGRGDAFDVTVYKTDDVTPQMQWDIFRTGNKQGSQLDMAAMQDRGVLCTFRSLYGSAWKVRLYVNRSYADEVVHVEWPIQLPDDQLNASL